MSLRITVADGDTTFGSLLSNSLSRAGHDVTVVTTSTDAKYALTKRGSVDVVFVDPDLLGSRVATILGNTVATRIFVCSNRSAEDLRLGPLETTVTNFEYLKKPFSFLDLEDRLQGVSTEASTIRKKVKSTGRTMTDGRRNAPSTGGVRGVSPEKTIQTNAATLNRLEREWRELQNVSPREVLGIPEDVGFDMAKEASQRMLGRYRQLANSDSESPRIRELSGKIADLVQGAWLLYKASLQADFP